MQLASWHWGIYHAARFYEPPHLVVVYIMQFNSFFLRHLIPLGINYAVSFYEPPYIILLTFMSHLISLGIYYAAVSSHWGIYYAVSFYAAVSSHWGIYYAVSFYAAVSSHWGIYYAVSFYVLYHPIGVYIILLAFMCCIIPLGYILSC